MSRLQRIPVLVALVLLAAAPGAHAQWHRGWGGVWLGLPPVVVAPPYYAAPYYPPAYYPPAYYPPPAYNAPAYNAPAYNAPAYYPPPSGSATGTSCVAAGGYVCPLTRPAPVGAGCGCPGNDGRVMQGRVQG